jgi:hypothetical protein
MRIRKNYKMKFFKSTPHHDDTEADLREYGALEMPENVAAALDRKRKSSFQGGFPRSLETNGTT